MGQLVVANFADTLRTAVGPDVRPQSTGGGGFSSMSEAPWTMPWARFYPTPTRVHWSTTERVTGGRSARPGLPGTKDTLDSLSNAPGAVADVGSHELACLVTTRILDAGEKSVMVGDFIGEARQAV